MMTALGRYLNRVKYKWVKKIKDAYKINDLMAKEY
jgi:hypothetical protein